MNSVNPTRPNRITSVWLRASFLLFLAFASVPLATAASPLEQERPSFPQLAVKELGGGLVNVSDFAGQPVLVNFWATWCGPCRLELPSIQRFYDRYNGKGLVVLSINTDSSTERVRPFLEKMNISLPVYTVNPEDQARLGVASIPTTILIDRGGKIVRSQAGYSGRFESEFGGLIEGLLAKKL